MVGNRALQILPLINTVQIYQSHLSEQRKITSPLQTWNSSPGRNTRNGTLLKCEAKQDATGRQMIGCQDLSKTRRSSHGARRLSLRSRGGLWEPALQSKARRREWEWRGGHQELLYWGDGCENDGSASDQLQQSSMTLFIAFLITMHALYTHMSHFHKWSLAAMGVLINMPFSLAKTCALAAMVTQQSTMMWYFQHCRSTLRV